MVDYSEIIAMSTSSYAGYPLLIALEHIAFIGIKQVEIAAISGQIEHVSNSDFHEKGASRINQYLKNLGLKTTAFSGHIFLSDSNATTKFRPRMDFAKYIGASIINTKAGPPRLKAQLYRNIEKLLEYAEKIKIKIGLETSNDIIKNGQDALKIIEYFSSPYLILTYDFGNVLVASGGSIDPAIEFEKILPKIGHIHIKEVIKDGDWWKITTVGSGAINYKKVLTIMRKIKEPISMTIELPFCIKMHEWKQVEINGKYKKLNEIDQILKESLNYIISQLNYLGN